MLVWDQSWFQISLRLGDCPVWQILQWRVCHVFRRVILRWSMSQAGATVNAPKAYPRRFSIRASITPLWALFSWTCACLRFPFPSAVHNSLPLHFVCKRAICTYYVYVLQFLLETDWHKLRGMLKGVWELVWKRLSVLRPIHKLSSTLCSDWWPSAKSEMGPKPAAFWHMSAVWITVWLLYV